MHATKIDIPAETREQVICLLNERLADLIDLHRRAKQAHWNVRGSNFLSLHKRFDDLAAVLDEHIDAVAERIAALGGIAEGTLSAVTKRTTLAACSLESVSGHDYLQALSTSLATVGRSMRSAVDRADNLADANTADLFTGVSSDLDKQLWLLEAHFESDCSSCGCNRRQAIIQSNTNEALPDVCPN